MLFNNFKKNIRQSFKSIINDIKYGNDNRVPLLYIPTYSEEASMKFSFENDSNISLEPFKSFKTFPKLSREILIELFRSVGILYVPEITIYYLRIKSPFEIFKNFCIEFGENSSGLIDTNQLNRVIEKLIVMDELRAERLFDSRPIYKALSHGDFEKADRLIDEKKGLK